jgi:hypothetical protein
MENLTIEKIRNSEFDEVAEILTDAFITNPAYSLIFTKKNQQKEGLLWLFKTSLFILNQKWYRFHLFPIVLPFVSN